MGINQIDYAEVRRMRAGEWERECGPRVELRPQALLRADIADLVLDRSLDSKFRELAV